MRMQGPAETPERQCVCEHRCLLRAEEGSGHVSACQCREHVCVALGMCGQVPAEVRVLRGHVCAGTYQRLSRRWTCECRFLQRPEEGSGCESTDGCRDNENSRHVNAGACRCQMGSGHGSAGMF